MVDGAAAAAVRAADTKLVNLIASFLFKGENNRGLKDWERGAPCWPVIIA